MIHITPAQQGLTCWHSKVLKLSVVSQTISHSIPICSLGAGEVRAWIHSSTCRAQAQAYSTATQAMATWTAPSTRAAFGCLSSSFYCDVESKRVESKKTPQIKRDKVKAVLLSCCERTELKSCKLCMFAHGLLHSSPIASYSATAVIMCLLNQHQQQPAELQIKDNQSVFSTELKIKWGLHGSSQSLCSLLFSTNQMDCHSAVLYLAVLWNLQKGNLQSPFPLHKSMWSTAQDSLQFLTSEQCTSTLRRDWSFPVSQFTSDKTI